MVRPEARRGDDDLGPVTDRTDRVEGRAVTTSSLGVRERHSTSDIPSTSAPIGPSMYYDRGAPRSSTRPPPIPFRTRPPTTSHHPYIPVPYPYGYSQPPQTSYDPYILLNEVSGPRLQLGAQSKKSRPRTNPTQRKKAKNDGWEQTGQDNGDPQDPVLVPSYSGHIANLNILFIFLFLVFTLFLQDRSILKSRSRYISLTGWTPSNPDLALVAESPRSGLSTEQRAAFYVLYLLGSSLFTNKTGNNTPEKLWLLVKNVSSIGGFAWGAATLAYLYRNLGQASRVDGKELSSCCLR
ncbi:hypothetical protein M9H77_27475 [Catharanthus roseus]|uniref:Uncharacterized protein n=1 Tax=Catharanthus roseus TaxID=4058 RepID=A0ACC0AFB5_CATRO|nr:hypothetical protein M9H77_27475 [Catharanthus roseus]